MLHKSNVGSKGELTILLKKASGDNEVYEFKNLAVSTGLNFIVSRMKEDTDAVMSHMSVGEGTTAADLGDITLESEIAGSRVALTSTTVTGNTITYVATFEPGVGTGAVTESGIFNDGTAGTMLCRTVFPVVNKQPGDSMTVNWTVTISNA